MSQTLKLEDARRVVLDEPRFVRMSQVMEVHTGLDGLPSVFGITGEGWLPNSATEIGSSV